MSFRKDLRLLMRAVTRAADRYANAKAGSKSLKVGSDGDGADALLRELDRLKSEPIMHATGAAPEELEALARDGKQ